MNSNQYILFLRAVNVSGKNIIKMAELKSLLIQEGFEGVKTYIQSGNVLLQSSLSKTDVQNKVHRIIQEKFELDITIFIYTQEELISILDKNPYKLPLEGNKVIITFIEIGIAAEIINKIKLIDIGNETFTIHNHIVYYYLPDGMAKSKLNNSFFEKQLKTLATGRNRNTIEKILLMSAQ